MKELIKIQNELKVPKNQKNNFGNYKYRSAEDILEAVKPLLYKYQVTLILTDEMVVLGQHQPITYIEPVWDSKAKTMKDETRITGDQRYYVKATAKLTNAKDESIEVSAFAREEETKKGMDSSQITGSASSYARKYALNGLFAIDDTKDSDATNTGVNEKPTIDEALSFVKKTKTISDLMQVWNMYPTFHTNEKFKNASTAKRKEIENAK